MPKITRDQVRVPADVMPESRDEYIENYMKATQGTGRLMLFACDQKVEHMNKDFYGPGIDIADADPQHLFEIGKAWLAFWPVSEALSRSTPPTTRRSTTW